MRGIRCLVAAVLAAGIVTVVAAQPGGRQPGGFGGQQDVTTLVLTNAALQEEVKVTDAQKAKFKVVADKQEELTKKTREMFGKGGKGGFDKEKFAEIREEGQKVAAEAKKVVEDTLTDAQKKRLKQINVQLLGMAAFTAPREGKGGKGGGGFGQSEAQKALIKEVQDALKLTEAQQSKIKAVTDEYAKDRNDIRKDVFGDKGGKGGFDQEKFKEFQTKSEKLAKQTMGQIEDTLTDAQKTTWKDLVGEPFDAAKLRPAPAPRKD